MSARVMDFFCTAGGIGGVVLTAGKQGGWETDIFGMAGAELAGVGAGAGITLGFPPETNGTHDP